MVDSIHLIVRVDSIHLMVNSIKGRLETFNGELYKGSTFHHSAPHMQWKLTPPPFHQSPPHKQYNHPFSPITTHKQCKQTPPPFFINHHCTKIANGIPPPLHQSPPENFRTCRKNENARKSPFGSFSNGHNHMYNVAQHTIVLRADSDMMSLMWTVKFKQI